MDKDMKNETLTASIITNVRIPGAFYQLCRVQGLGFRVTQVDLKRT